MLAFLGGTALALVHFLACVYATVRSASSGFRFGVRAGVVRACLLVLATAFALRGTSLLVSATATWLGAPLSFATVFVAYRRARDVPAAKQEAADRPFMAWVPTAIIDALTVLIAVASAVFARDP